jgi:hypothetical protein
MMMMMIIWGCKARASVRVRVRFKVWVKVWAPW